VKPSRAGAGIAAAVGACAVAGFLAGRAWVSGEAHPERSVRATPGVVTMIRDVARLEATSFHIEKVVEATDRQKRLWGFVEAKDALLLVAVGDVVAGVDLDKLRDEDVHVDADAGAVTVRLPPPEILSVALDERATHVYSRSTDTLAAHDEQLEGDARRAAEEQMRKAALDEGILDRARVSAGRTLGGLLRSLGYEHVDVGFRDAT
jgi:hypothetical protein